jgi:hypothetical protein
MMNRELQDRFVAETPNGAQRTYSNREVFSMRTILAVGAVCLLTAVKPAYAQLNYTLTAVDYPGASNTVILAINNRAEVVGYFTDSAGAPHGFLRTGGQFTVIDVPGGFETSATGINDLGQIVGTYVTNPATESSRGFLFDGHTYSTISPPGAVVTYVNGINNRGQIAGGYIDANSRRHAFLLTYGQYVELVPNEPDDHEAAAIGNDGRVLGMRFSDAFRFFRLTPDGTKTGDLQAPQSSLTEAFGINSSGEVVGTQIILDPPGCVLPAPCTVLHIGFVFAFGGFAPLGMPGVDSTALYGINDRHQVVGSFIDRPDANGVRHEHGFMATLTGDVEDVSVAASPDGSRIPGDAVVYDQDLNAWTLGPQEEVFRNGAQAANGYGSNILWHQGSIYVRGSDANWWRWSGNIWVFAGTRDPSA